MDGLEEPGCPQVHPVAPGVLVLARPGAAALDEPVAGGVGGASVDGVPRAGGGAGGGGATRAPRRSRAAGPGAARSRLSGAAPRLLLAVAVAAGVLGIVAIMGRPAVGGSDVTGPRWTGSGEPAPLAPSTAGPSTSTAPSTPRATPSPSDSAPAVVAPGAAPSSGPADWLLVMTQLDAQRTAALSSLDVDLLLGYAAAGSSALADDEALIGKLEVRGLRPVGLATSIDSAEVEGSASGATVLRVVDHRGPYTLVDQAGAVVEQVAGSAARTWRVTLEPSGSAPQVGDPGWRVVEVAAVS